MNQDITDKTINGNCSKCGACCSNFIPVTKQEVRLIKSYVQKHNIKPEQRIENNSIKVLCPFFNEKEHKCNIYEVRPYACRDFICNRKDWKEHRQKYAQRADYNGLLYNAYTMDELIYDDIYFFVRFVVELARDKDGNVIYERLINILTRFKRLDILQFLKFEVEE